MQVSRAVESGKAEPGAGGRVIGQEQAAQVFDDGEAARGQLALGGALTEDDFGLHHSLLGLSRDMCKKVQDSPQTFSLPTFQKYQAAN